MAAVTKAAIPIKGLAHIGVRVHDGVAYVVLTGASESRTRIS